MGLWQDSEKKRGMEETSARLSVIDEMRLMIIKAYFGCKMTRKTHGLGKD